jgi:SAM-dependent methyltransferase
VEIRRILKDGGFLLITHPNKYNLLDETLEWFKENKWIRRMLKRPTYQGVQHVQSFYYNDTIKALRPFHFNIYSRHALTFSLFRLFSIFVYGRFKWDNSFELQKKFIKGERFIIQRLGTLGQLLSGSCIMLFQLNKKGAPPLTPQK